jgi:hypothetical protein
MSHYLLIFCLLSLNAQASVSTAWLSGRMEERVQYLKNSGAQGHQVLAKAAFDSGLDLQTRWRAITTMGRWNAASFRSELDRALQSKEWFLRNAALIALQNDDREHAVQSSVRLLRDSALVVRTQAVRNLILLEARESEPVLWQEIFNARNFHKSQSLWVRAYMAEALARFADNQKDARHAKAFQRLLMDPDARLHRWAVIGLERSTGFKLTTSSEPVEIRRQKWLTQLGVQEI